MKFFPIRRDILWPCLLAGTITLCSGYPAQVPQTDWIQMDKLGHLAAYGALATGIARIRGLERWRGLGLLWAILFASGYGLGDEFRQMWGGVRTYDLADWVADTIGATLAVVLYLRWPRYRRLLEWSLPGKRRKPQVEISAESMPNAAP